MDDRRVNLYGLERFHTTTQAQKLIETAGYEVRVTHLSYADLPVMHATIGVTRLPAAKTASNTLQGMRAIRAHFG